MLAPRKKSYDQPRQHIKKQRHYFANKGLSSQSYGFSSSCVWMWELDYKEIWASKNWCFWTVVLEKTLESPLDCKEIKPVSPKGNEFWIFTGRTDAEPETPILWPPDAKNWLTGKDSDARKDWRWEEKGMTEDEMVDASLTRWTWVWVSFRSWWWTGKPGVLHFMGSQRVGHDWTELNWTELKGDVTARSCPTLVIPWTVAHQTPLFIYSQGRILEWFAISFPGHLPNPGIEPGSPPLQADSLPSESPEKPLG